MKTWIILLLVLLAGLQCDLWLSSGGITSVLNLKKDVEKQVMTNQKLIERNHLLEMQVNELKKGQEALEDKARSGLGMIDSDEIFYQVIEEKSTSTSAKS
jgi:cell division protein FtsB